MLSWVVAMGFLTSQLAPLVERTSILMADFSVVVFGLTSLLSASSQDLFFLK
jgi:hypothetical protein